MLQRLGRPVLRPWARRRLKVMAATGAGCAPQLALALLDVMDDRYTTDERRWIERIEARRAQLMASNEPIEVIDYGAGGQRDTRSAEQMYAGQRRSTTVSGACAGGSKTGAWCAMLMKLVQQFGAKNCLEMGACAGISAAYQAAALSLRGEGNLISIEGDPALAHIASQTLVTLGLSNAQVVVGRFQDKLAGVLSASGPFDYAFIDGHHDEHATLQYFEQIEKHAADRALLVFDDIAWSAGMQRAWQAVGRDKRVSTSLDLGSVGLAVLDRSATVRKTWRVWIV